ncbi:hypothetical protein ACFXKG_31050 [Streptomyces sp. NPDC059255]|uniref:hypothetical protein n=1 Tax=Streptomyces sp. NPDC059255 TaxID=3346793 RepID=UPI0036849CF4
MSEFSGGSFSVQRGPNNDEACTASWSWVKPLHFLEAQPENQPGVTLSWSSQRGPSGGWSYTVVSESGRKDSGRLPAPVLAAPAAILAMMPELWRGRHRLLRATEDLWEWAALTESATESARLVSENKYDFDYQMDEEEGESFDQWQAELEAADADQQPATEIPVHSREEASLGSAETAGLIRYRIVAQRIDPQHPGASVLTNYAYARSIEEAVAKARKELKKPGGLYGDRGMYRVVEVVEESPSSELLQQEDARRRYLTTILENATAAVRGRGPEDPDADLVSRLDDFFTRAVVFPDPYTGGVHPRPHQATFGWTSEQPCIEHASDPGRALALFLLAYLDHYGLELEAAVRTSGHPDRQPVSGSRPSARDAEGGEASADLVERVLDVCGQHYAAVTGTSSDEWDQEWAREVVGIALRTVRMAERDTYPQILETYLHERRARLEMLWRIYGPAGVFPQGVYHLVEQPGSFVLCERIDNDPMWLKGVWSRECESETPLERLEEAWLYGTSESDGR